TGPLRGLPGASSTKLYRSVHTMPNTDTNPLDQAYQKHAEWTRSLPSVEHLAALAKAGRSARSWYRSAGRLIGNVFGHEAPRFTALPAATSGNKAVKDNLRIAAVVWKHYKQLTGGQSRPLTGRELDTLHKRLKSEVGNLPSLNYTLSKGENKRGKKYV